MNSSLHGQKILNYPSCITVQIQTSTVHKESSTVQQQPSTLQLPSSSVQLQSKPNTKQLEQTKVQSHPSSVQYCTCNTDLCNGHLYDYTDTRVKRHKTRFQDDFFFPFQESGDDPALGTVSQQRHIKCYSCGSLFNREAPSCDKFQYQNESQRATCKPGEVCLLYQWNKNREEKGKIEGNEEL